MTMTPGFNGGTVERWNGGTGRNSATALRRRDDRERHVAPVSWCDRGVEEPFVEAVAGIQTMVAYDLVARERPDRRTHDHVARPVAVVVHAREPNEGRAPIHRGTNHPHPLRPPDAGFCGHRRS